MFRLLLVVMVTLSASVSGAMNASHMAAVEHSHTSVGEVADDQPICCSEGSERTQTCHSLAALLPGADLNDTAPATCEDVSIVTGVLLTGIEPSGPLDPPRAL
ncbi:hypothetical protein MWU52_03955 [Jannaschia sp. S6380]|uniref:hypothetical protein n=1 Tax=Jannaschia sp. S6380 TaxID=2926408 RepID=UPI001FF6EDE7|nr:hypothetical protein [Jannaschia sp. S6380]MCK0166700.1 hypothetical protein [Jannaschia sp. S6380]